MPFRVPKMYFADHCARTSNFVLITEKVPFDVDGFEAAHDKYMDHKLPRPAHEYYFVLMRQLGRMVAAYKSGRLGRGLEASFPTESAVVATGHPSMMKAKVSTARRRWVSRLCRQQEQHDVPLRAFFKVCLDTACIIWAGGGTGCRRRRMIDIQASP